MKVYVDELPKSCGDCVFCKQTEYYYYCDKLHTKLGYIDKDKDCPLQSIANHDKQVRKEVCEEIRDKMTHWEDCLTKEVTEYVIDKETLDKIEQGENK